MEFPVHQLDLYLMSYVLHPFNKKI